MDYSSMKKEELIELLKDQVHLANAVDAKDKEINHLKKMADERESALKNEVSNLQSEVNKWQKIAQENKVSKEANDALLIKNAELVDFGNGYVKMHSNMIQSIQGILELSSDLEKTLIEKIRKSQEK